MTTTELPALSLLIIKQIIVECVRGDRYMLSFPFLFVNKNWNRLFDNDSFWQQLCYVRWTSLSLLPQDYTPNSNLEDFKPVIEPSCGGSVDDDEDEDDDYLFGTNINYPKVKSINGWKDVFISRYYRTYHLRIQQHFYMSGQYLVCKIRDQQSITNQALLAKKMKALDQDHLDMYRDDLESLFVLESVEYHSIEQIGYHHSKCTDFRTEVIGSVMTLSGKRIKFQLRKGRDHGYSYEDYDTNILIIGSAKCTKEYLLKNVPGFWEKVKVQMKWNGSLEKIQEIICDIMQPETEIDAFGLPHEYFQRYNLPE
ncbi:hypothetical protein DFA_01799 [Cavenderia fasciculata]|uniref:F-box domain-containing protein n=1 Tax=Cavenderia fasciculata TaxID=261658 RepID=F4PUV1_CACFS|nr:uncharacterized protein DFA_01799 [Cavenderia fasciculata]EGG21913.1 hypothetical protein DFA_01799 [Cavenderia fasciculata]|eukprot:XP_004359764.1 hypothetical protein DFA_01799 [Cavenderia fasciculata]